MKNITKFLMAFLCLGMIFASCNKNNIDYDELNRQQIEAARKEKARRDALLKTQAPLLEQYAKTNWKENARYSDSTGIWYKVELATDNSTPYSYTGSIGYYGAQPNAWSATLNFKGELMNGTVFDKNTEGVPKVYDDIRVALKTYGQAWVQAFIPTIINIQGKDERFEGLLQKGLQKGDKISFIAPSYYSFDEVEYTAGSEKVTVPKNTPVVYTIDLKAVGPVK